MPKNSRFADTLAFIRLQGQSAPPVRYAAEVADVLDSFTGAIPPAVDSAMSMGRAGTEQSRKYRRAMILILCVLNNTPTGDAQRAVALIPETSLPTALAKMLEDVAVIYGRRRFAPLITQLLNQPLQFLTNNRIKLGRGALTASGMANFAMSWHVTRRYYEIEPPSLAKTYVHGLVPGYNIAVSQYRDIKDEIHNIPASSVEGNLAVTTQLSSCTVIYRVSGGSLTVAHINPERAYTNRHLPQDLAHMVNDPPGVVQTHRMARDANLAGAGTLGLYGMLPDGANTGLQYLGPRRVRTHGYTAANGNGYFIGVRVGGDWQLFAQQNNPASPATGVSSIMQIYP